MRGDQHSISYSNKSSDFLSSLTPGDFQRLRLLSSSTPPSSPPPTGTSMSSVQGQAHSPSLPPAHSNNNPTTLSASASTSASVPPVIEPMLALELRLRWLEAILLGVRHEKGKDREREREQGETLCRASEDIQRQLNNFVEGNEGLKRFMESCECHPSPPPSQKY